MLAITAHKSLSVYKHSISLETSTGIQRNNTLTGGSPISFDQATITSTPTALLSRSCTSLAPKSISSLEEKVKKKEEEEIESDWNSISYGRESPIRGINYSSRMLQMTPTSMRSSADISQYEGCKGRASIRLQMISNFIMLTSSLLLIGTGAGLMGFYRLHMLEVITVDFLIVPLIMVGGGIFTLFTALFGFCVTMREDACLMITYAIFMSVDFLLVMVGIVSSVRLLFDIQTGLFDSDVIPELAIYETDAWTRHKWDTLQREFTCCGGYGYTVGYTDWKHTMLGGAHNSVPDSCCLYETPQCGANVFDITDLRVVIGKIHTHGCLSIMLVRLQTHVNVILIVFSVMGGILGIIQLLCIVLACCFANQIAKFDKNDVEDPWRRRMAEEEEEERLRHFDDHSIRPIPCHNYSIDGGGNGVLRSCCSLHSSSTPQMQQSFPSPSHKDLSSRHETAF